MYNLLLSLAVGAVAAIAVGSGFGWVAAVAPGLIAAIATYIVLARRTGRQLERIFESMQKDLQSRPPRIDKAVATLQAGFPLGRWQFGIEGQLHSAIGQLLYVKPDLDAALPHLEKSWVRQWVARGMLAAGRYKKRDPEAAVRIFEEAVKSSKKEGLLWATYAWVLEDMGRHDEAIRVLGRGVAANEKDERLKTALQALQNGKKLKLGKVYSQEWFQFRLEDPPPQFVGGPGGMRGNKRALYGR
jgi:tetratricopeptide (TPR) repeat protein